jgi:hypothetical protein
VLSFIDVNAGFSRWSGARSASQPMQTVTPVAATSALAIRAALTSRATARELSDGNNATAPMGA